MSVSKSTINRVISAMTLVACLVTSAGLFAQSAGGASGGGSTGGAAGGAVGTNSAGTANSSGGRAGTPSTVGTGAGPTNIDGAPQTGNAAVDAQDKAVDKKVKSICKGC